MDTVSRNYKNSKAPIPHRLLLIVIDKINKKVSDKHIVVSNLSIYYTRKNIKKSQKYKKFKISAPTWSGEFELLDGSYSVSDISDYFEYTFKKWRRD